MPLHYFLTAGIAGQRRRYAPTRKQEQARHLLMRY